MKRRSATRKPPPTPTNPPASAGSPPPQPPLPPPPPKPRQKRTRKDIVLDVLLGDDDDDEVRIKQGPVPVPPPNTSIFIRQSSMPDTLASFLAGAMDSLGTPPAPSVHKQLILEREKELLNHQAAVRMDGTSNSSMTLRERILLSNAPLDVKTLLFRKLREAYGQSGESPVAFSSVLSTNSSETTKSLGWIEVVLSFPFGIYKPIALRGSVPTTGAVQKEVDIMSHLRHVKNMLDKHVYKHEQAKASILGYVARTLYSPSRSNVVMLLNGPPAVGKTRLARFVATALGIPFQTLSLAQIRDPSVVVGHSPTYVSARPGRIALSLIQAKSLRTVIFLDELDKVSSSVNSESGSVADVTSVLLQAMDPESSHEWDADCFFSPIKLDLSQVVWIAACNNKEVLSPILRDRAWVIDVEPLSFQDRIEILVRIVFPEALKELGMGDWVGPLPSAVAKHIMSKAEESNQGGMRDLKRCVAQMLERLMLVRIAANANEPLDDLFPFARRAMPCASDLRAATPMILTLDWVDFLSWDPEEDRGKRSHRESNMYT